MPQVAPVTERPAGMFHRSSIPRRRFGLTTASVLASLLLLAGCATGPSVPASESPSGTATSTAAPAPVVEGAPKNEAGATEAATVAVAAFYETMASVQSAGATDPGPLATVAAGPALESVTADSAWLAENGYAVSGAMAFSPISASAGDLLTADGQVYPFGLVLVTGCQDTSGYDVTLDGAPVPLGVAERTGFELTVVFEPSTKAWLVQKIGGEDRTC